MKIFPWHAVYGMKLRGMDHQHETLFATINELHTAMTSGQGREVMENTLNNLQKYSQTHFLSEESLMQRCRYPRRRSHQQEHQSFARKVVELKEKWVSNNRAPTLETMEFLNDWLIRHIMESDRAFDRFLTEQGLGDVELLPLS